MLTKEMVAINAKLRALCSRHNGAIVISSSYSYIKRRLWFGFVLEGDKWLIGKRENNWGL